MELKKVCKSYNLKQENIEVLKNINYKFQMGKFYVIMGHSGCGKSTLIKILGLMDKPTSGSYLINDKDVAKMGDSELANLRMKYIGFVFQDFNLDENLNALDNVILPMLINKDIKRNERKEIAINLLKKVGLDKRIKHKPRELSGGECGRVAIARSLANNPNVILADEPTGNLDKENEKKILEELKNLAKEGKCVIVVSHSNEVNKYADVRLELLNGVLKKYADN